jgi:hypothetical protein
LSPLAAGKATRFRSRPIYLDRAETTDLYTKQCSLNVSAKDLAVMGATLADGEMFVQFRKRSVVLAMVSVVAIVFFLWLVPPLHQNQSYHAFADQRMIFGVRNFWDVVSNLPFAIVGLMGLFAFRDFASRIIFLGIFFTAFGSAYYHLSPDNPRLFWDRLPMTVVFMSLFALAVNHPRTRSAYRGPRIKQRSLVIPLVLVGVASIVWWKLTDNLWPYALVQFGPMIPLIVIAVRREPGLRPVLIFYGLSKITEFFDKQIYAVSPLSGHTLKHLLAGVATWYIYRWIQSSQPELQPTLAGAPVKT